MMWNGDNDTLGWASWLLMGITMLAILCLLAWGAFLLWRAAQGQGTGAPGPQADRPPTPEVILGERFARGEIDADEYRSRLDALRDGGRTPIA